MGGFDDMPFADGYGGTFPRYHVSTVLRRAWLAWGQLLQHCLDRQQQVAVALAASRWHDAILHLSRLIDLIKSQGEPRDPVHAAAGLHLRAMTRTKLAQLHMQRAECHEATLQHEYAIGDLRCMLHRIHSRSSALLVRGSDCARLSRCKPTKICTPPQCSRTTNRRCWQ